MAAGRVREGADSVLITRGVRALRSQRTGSRFFLFLAFFFLLLEDAFENFTHVLDCLENLAGDENRALLLKRHHDGVAGPGIEFEKLAPEFVLHVQDDAGKVSALI